MTSFRRRIWVRNCKYTIYIYIFFFGRNTDWSWNKTCQSASILISSPLVQSGDAKNEILLLLNLKRLGVNLTRPVVFPKLYFLERRWSPWFLVTYNIIIRDIFHENFIEIHHLVQKIWRFSLSILVVSANFLDFWHLLVAKKLMTPAYNRCCQHFFFSFNLLYIGCLITASSHISIGLVFLKYIDPPYICYCIICMTVPL